MANESIWSSAAYAFVGVATNQTSAVASINPNAIRARESRPPSCQTQSPAARNCTINLLSPMSGRQGSFGLAPRLTGRNSLPFVVHPLSGCQGDFDLGVPIGEVQRQWHQGGP